MFGDLFQRLIAYDHRVQDNMLMFEDLAERLIAYDHRVKKVN